MDTCHMSPRQSLNVLCMASPSTIPLNAYVRRLNIKRHPNTFLPPPKHHDTNFGGWLARGDQTPRRTVNQQSPKSSPRERLPPEVPFPSGDVEGGEGGDSANANTADTMLPLLAGSGSGGCRGAPEGKGEGSSSIVLSKAVAQDTRRLIS